jgi:hypothetical protein
MRGAAPADGADDVACRALGRGAARTLVAVFLAVVALAAPAAGAGTVVLLPVDVDGLGPDGPRARAALLQALRTTLGAELLVRQDVPVAPAAGMSPAGACRASATCLAAVAAGEDVDEVVHVRADRVGAGAQVWGRVVLEILPARGERTLTLTTTLSTGAADRDLRGLVLRAFDPTRYVGRLAVLGVVAGDVLLVDELPASSTTLALRPGPHVVRVCHRDGSEIVVPVDVVLDERVVVDVAPAARSSIGAATTAPTTTTAEPTTTTAEPTTRPLWPAALHAGVALVAAGTAAVAVVGAATGGIRRDVGAVAGISVSSVVVASGVAAATELLRVVDSRRTTTNETTNETTTTQTTTQTTTNQTTTNPAHAADDRDPR